MLLDKLTWVNWFFPTFRLANLKFLETSILFKLLSLTFSDSKLTKSLIPVKSVIPAVETSKEVKLAMLAVKTFPSFVLDFIFDQFIKKILFFVYFFKKKSVFN